ncbi:MAG: recombinase family protein, partial [Roseibium sp.]
GYARVSTPDQRLDMQLDALNAVACDPVFSDHGLSGGLAERPGLDKALKALEAGDVLVVFKLDRLGRSVLHLADLLTRFEKEGIHFCSLSEGIDTTTSGGKLVYHLFSAFAEFQRDIIRENTVAGLVAARARGSRLGRPPKLDTWDVLEAHRQIRQDGRSIEEIAERCGVSSSTVSRAIRRVELEAA